MRRRITLAAAALSFIVLVGLLVWQGSFRIEYSPTDVSETVVLWAISTVIFLLTVTLGFMLFRALVKVYIDRQRNREGSRLRSKMLAGALVLTLAPTLFYVVFSVFVLNRHLEAWFSRPAKNIQEDLKTFERSYRDEAQLRVQAEANWFALLPDVREAARTGRADPAAFAQFCANHEIQTLTIESRSGALRQICLIKSHPSAPLVSATSKIGDIGAITITAAMANETTMRNLAAKQEAIRHYAEVESSRRRNYQGTYFRLICLITVFVLFFAVWSAQLLSRQISIPIAALLGAAGEIRRGNLSYRIRVDAMDELATLVRAFNEMSAELEGNSHELERRRHFIEAILESIPTGVISVSSREQIEHINRAMPAILPAAEHARTLTDLFTPEDLAEIRYLFKRARRTGSAGSQLELERQDSIIHLAVTVAALEHQRGFVLVLEDTSELLRAQRATAWQEVARRIAHEIKNPLTPISLCADRIGRQLRKLTNIDPTARAILNESADIIRQEVESVRTLVDEFSHFSRFPTAHPVPANLNEIVESAMTVFAGRLENVDVEVELDQKLPPVLVDKEQIKRVIVNLVDNAAEAMQSTPVKRLRVATMQVASDSVELSVTDTGPGVSPSDREKLFLPYFSTKARGTGLGLAIVSRIVAEHRGRIRVEDNLPAGTRFIVELNVAAPDLTPVESNAVVQASKA